MKIHLGEKAVDHNGVETYDEEKGQKVAKDEETDLRARLKLQHWDVKSIENL